MASLEPVTIGVRLDGSEIDYMLTQKTVEHAFEACSMLLACDPYVSDAVVVRSQEDVVIEIEGDRCGLRYVPVRRGQTAEGIYRRIIDELNDGNL
jgi:hypothetical protein